MKASELIHILTEICSYSGDLEVECMDSAGDWRFVTEVVVFPEISSEIINKQTITIS
jgi:hypothetical protein